MAGRMVQLRVGGQTYRVVSSAGEEELQRLASAVDARIAELIPPGRPVTPQVMLLAAMAFAHDLEEERARSAALTMKAKGTLGRLLERVDAALELEPQGAAGPLAAPPPLVATSPAPAGPVLIAVGPLMGRSTTSTSAGSRSPDDR